MPLTLFISYAHEDSDIAQHLSNALSRTFGNDIVVLLDKFFMLAGGPVLDTVRKNVSDADVLIIIATGRERRSHDWGGTELGAFVTAHQVRPSEANKMWGWIICFCWSKEMAPDQLKANLHVTLEVTDDQLIKPEEQYLKELKVERGDLVLGVFEEVYETINRKPATENKADQDRLADNVKDFKKAIFRVYKQRMRATKKLEKQMIVHFPASDLAGPGEGLKDNAKYKLLGGAGAIFGLPDTSPDCDRPWMTEFAAKAEAQQHGQFWVETLQRLLRVSMSGGIEKLDYEPVIFAQNGRTLYRPILTTLSEFNNDDREASIYFVEVKRRVGHGDPDTTRLLEGLDAVCRFSFLFLEEAADYSSLNASVLKDASKAKRFADELMAEMHYLENDLTAAGLDKPATWTKFVSEDLVTRTMVAWRPLRDGLRNDCRNIISCQSNDEVLRFAGELTQRLIEVRTTMHPLYSELLTRLTKKLGELGGEKLHKGGQEKESHRKGKRQKGDHRI